MRGSDQTRPTEGWPTPTIYPTFLQTTRTVGCYTRETVEGMPRHNGHLGIGACCIGGASRYPEHGKKEPVLFERTLRSGGVQNGGD